jgi:sulfite reductase alpha subunit-like flavoprotein
MICLALKEQHGLNVIPAMLESRKIVSENHGGTILVRLEVDKSESYLPGDHIAVYPVNKDIDVELILSHMSGLPADPVNTVVQLQEPREGYGKMNDFLICNLMI